MGPETKAFFDMLHRAGAHRRRRNIGQLLQELERAGATITAATRVAMTRARAADFARHEIARIIESAALNNPEMSVEEIVECCMPALIDALMHMDRF
jgi:nucleoside diphosphate kinase